uniref:Uncharacterized protein n=1 Tax=Lotus japonicus TaxID=34305 RepID=I3RZZ1_LOTJA|nr:unknown [Lotus japonicus]
MSILMQNSCFRDGKKTFLRMIHLQVETTSESKILLRTLEGTGMAIKDQGIVTLETLRLLKMILMLKVFSAQPLVGIEFSTGPL